MITEVHTWPGVVDWSAGADLTHRFPIGLPGVHPTLPARVEVISFELCRDAMSLDSQVNYGHPEIKLGHRRICLNRVMDIEVGAFVIRNISGVMAKQVPEPVVGNELQKRVTAERRVGHQFAYRFELLDPPGPYPRINDRRSLKVARQPHNPLQPEI